MGDSMSGYFGTDGSGGEQIHMLSDIHWVGMQFFADRWVRQPEYLEHWWDGDRIVVERYMALSERSYESALRKEGLSVMGVQLITRFDGCIFVRGFMRLGMLDQHIDQESTLEVDVIRRLIDELQLMGDELMASPFGIRYLSGDFRVQLDAPIRALVALPSV